MQPIKLHNVIAIDGPAASGKSTIGMMLARRLDYLCLDTGLMYRALTLAAIHHQISPYDEAGIIRLAHDSDIDVLPPAGEADGRLYTVLLDRRDVTWDLRRPAVEESVSQVSLYPEVRVEMVRRQRDVARRGRVVMVGRDIGTVVVPDAALKLYITASPEERARRRLLDRQRQGYEDSYEAILADVVRRDHIDSNRRHSPLQPAADAVVIDTTGRTTDEVMMEIMALVAALPARNEEHI